MEEEIVMWGGEMCQATKAIWHMEEEREDECRMKGYSCVVCMYE